MSEERRYFVDLDEIAYFTNNNIPAAANESHLSKTEAIFIKSELDTPRSLPSDGSIADFSSISLTQQQKHAITYETDNGNHVTLNTTRQLGNGRHSRVFLGRLSRSGSETIREGLEAHPDTADEELLVAIKLCYNDAESTSYGVNEANILKTLAGASNVIRLYDTITRSSGSFYFALILQFADGGNCLDYVQRPESKLSPSLVTGWTRDLFRALAETHKRGILHLDIKPHNLIIADGQILVADWGNARRLDASATDVVLGTLGYTAPELLTSALETPTTSADIYSAGVTLYTLITGRDPFASISRSGVALMIAIRQGFFSAGHNPWITDKGDALKSIIHDCTRPNPLARPTADQILLELHP